MGNKFKKLKLDELNRMSPDEFKNQPKIALTVVLDNIRSLHNIGSIFRTSDAFRVHEIILSGITAQPPHREIHKTALGATETVNWSYYKYPEEVIEKLYKEGIKIYPVEQTENSTDLLNNSKPDSPIALIFGNEVDGVSEEYMKAAELVIEIPQEGTKHSLNVSISAGIVIWEMFKLLK